MTAAYWTLSQAAAWIAMRSEQAVEETPRAMVHALLTDAEGSGFPKAREMLWEALQTGSVTATGIGADGERRAIPAERWQDLEAILDGKAERLQRPRLQPGETFTEVTLRAGSVKEFWSAGAARAADPVPSRSRREHVATLIKARWPEGCPAGLLVKDWENQIRDFVKTQGGSAISTRTVRRAIKLAK